MVKVFNFEIPCDYGKPTCYHWWGVQAVSSKNDYENQIVATSAAGEMCLLLSAESLLIELCIENIAYYAVGESCLKNLAWIEISLHDDIALYLDKNEWYTGTSGPLPIPPSDPPSNPTSEA